VAIAEEGGGGKEDVGAAGAVELEFRFLSFARRALALASSSSTAAESDEEDGEEWREDDEEGVVVVFVVGLTRIRIMNIRINSEYLW